jgi:hypothetical protein
MLAFVKSVVSKLVDRHNRSHRNHILIKSVGVDRVVRDRHFYYSLDPIQAKALGEYFQVSASLLI